MPQTQTTHLEQLTLDGPLPFWITALLAGGLLLLFAWSLRKELPILGKRRTILFWALRSVALLVAFWMLLAPSNVLEESSTTKQSLTFAVDVSQSMKLQDKYPGSWQISAASRDNNSELELLQRSLATLQFAEKRLHLFQRGFDQQKSDSELAKHLLPIYRALSRTITLLKTVSNGADLAARIQGADYRRLKLLTDELERGQRTLPANAVASLKDFALSLVPIRKQLSLLIQRKQLAATETSSDNLQPVAENRTRIGRVESFLQDLKQRELDQLADKTHLHWATFAEHYEELNQLDKLPQRVNSLSSETTQLPMTDVSSALNAWRTQKQEQPIAALFLLSDMSHNKIGSNNPLEVAQQLQDTPLYIVPIGETKPRRDVALKAISAPVVVMKNDEIVIEATVQAYDCAGEELLIELMRDGETIQQRKLLMENFEDLRQVRFNTLLSETGAERFQIRVMPLADELSEENNLSQFEVNVTRDRIKVLLADELPRWEYRYLTQLFRRDEKVTCDEMLFQPRVIATGERAESRSLPTEAADWQRYDVVILGDLATNHLPVAAQESLSRYLKEFGGTLVMISGTESMPQAYTNQPLEDLLPVVRSEEKSKLQARDGYAFHVTEEGWKHSALMIAETESSTRIAWDFISQNSPLHMLSDYHRARPAAHTLLSAIPRTELMDEHDPDQHALLCWQPLGRGRIIYLASPETYRLRFLRGDELHFRFWGQLLRWAIANDLAAGSEMIRIRTDQATYGSNEEIFITVNLQDELGQPVPSAQFEVVADIGESQQTTTSMQPDSTIPGQYTGTIRNLPTGIHRLHPEGDAISALEQVVSGGENAETTRATSTSVMVRNPINHELLETRCNLTLANQLAEASGGQVIPPAAIPEILALTDLEPQVTHVRQIAPLWVEWKFLWIIFACLFVEWVMRKRLGLS